MQVDLENVENKGALWGKSVEEVKSSGIINGDTLDMKYLFGDLEGSVLLEQIFKFWGDTECDVPWFYAPPGSGPVGQGNGNGQLRKLGCQGL